MKHQKTRRTSKQRKKKVKPSHRIEYDHYQPNSPLTIYFKKLIEKLPINIFLKGDFRYFRSTLVSLNSKDVKIVEGPTVRLSEIANKRVKRKTIQLVRKPT